MLALVLLASLAAADADNDGDVDAGPQPGDVDETVPLSVDLPPAPLDAGPAVPVEAQPQAQDAGPVPDPDAAAAAPVDPQPVVEPAGDEGAPVVDPAAPVVDPAAPVVEHVAPRPDPDAERAPPPPPPPPPAKTPAPLPEGLGFGGVPAINFDADNGFGFGVVATGFYYDGHTRPYRASVTLQIFMTSKLVQDHNIVVDWLDVAGLPLRLYTRVGYLQSLTQNYCGIGGSVSCDTTLAAKAAADEGLDGEAADAFVRRFTQRRFIDPYGTVQARWALVTSPSRFELTAGYRGFYFIPGTWDDEDGDGKPDLFPYPGSLYARDHPDGEPGFGSTVTGGFMYDSRDNEPAPTEGVWLEASVRASSKLIGSTWDWAGANLTLRGYVPLRDNHRLVLANRFVVDGVVGDPPIQELVRVGGSNDYYVYGGSEAGRGIRAQRYIGKLRVFDQNELRWRFLDVTALEQHFGFTAAAFADLGLVGAEVTNPGPMELLPGFGGALRLSWNENFVVRFDLGVSPLEDYAPSLYILIGNPF